MNLKQISIVALATILLIGCNPKSNGTAQKGEQVPNEFVCMVGDTYKKKQGLTVPIDGKTYYVFCKVCQKRIVTESNLRYSIDPHTLEKVDKAMAYIVLLGDNGKVPYFKDEVNYINFIGANRN